MSEVPGRSGGEDLKSQIFVLRVPGGGVAAELEHVNVGAVSRHDTLEDAFDQICEHLGLPTPRTGQDRRH